MFKELFESMMMAGAGMGGEIDPKKPVREQVQAQLTEQLQSEVNDGSVLIDTLIAKGVITQEDLNRQQEIQKQEIADAVAEKFNTDPKIAGMMAEIQTVINNKEAGLCGCGKDHSLEEDEEEMVTPQTETVMTDKTTIH